MCVLSVLNIWNLLEGRERSISTLKFETPGCNLMCKWVQWGWGGKCGEPKQKDASKPGIFKDINSLPWPLHHHQPSSAASSSGATGSCWISTSAVPRGQLGIKKPNYIMQVISLPSPSITTCRTKEFYFLSSAFFPWTTTYFWYPLTLQKPRTILLPWQNSERLSEKQPAFEISAGKSRPRKPGPSVFNLLCTTVVYLEKDARMKLVSHQHSHVYRAVTLPALMLPASLLSVHKLKRK